ASRASIRYLSMICCGVPRTLPSGPEESKTRLTTLPSERCRFDFERERDLDDLMCSCLSEPRAVLPPALSACVATVPGAIADRDISGRGAAGSENHQPVTRSLMHDAPRLTSGFFKKRPVSAAGGGKRAEMPRTGRPPRTA